MNASVCLYDAHNHLQDSRLQLTDELWAILSRERVRAVVVNGCCENDWPEVQRIADLHPEFVVPSYGYHPWYVKERSADWKKVLLEYLNNGKAAVGEIGLDCWIRNPDIQSQEEVFSFQMELAAERNLPASIHCLQAWGRLFDLLRSCPRPECGFVLHSYGGSREMIQPLAKLGAYFSLPGHFAHERKARHRETFLHVPPDRLLIETDAPDQCLPVERVRYPLPDDDGGKPVNHPGNIRAVYEFAAGLHSEELERLAVRVETNFLRIFGGLLTAKS